MKTQTLKFNHIVQTLYDLSLEDRLKIKTLLEHSIAETRRDEIVNNFEKSQEELKSGEITFSSKIDELKKML